MTEGVAETGDAPASWFDRLAGRPLMVLLLLAAFAWLPGLATLPPLDRDESRFAEASRQMVESGNYIDIRFAAGTRYNKPVGVYWLQAAAATLSGPALRDRIFVYRLPSLIGGILTLLFAYGCARNFASRKTALLASMLLGTTLLLTAESDIATTDAALLATIVAAQSVMMRVYLSARDARIAAPGRGTILGGWAAIGTGVLVKGPVILAVLGATALALSLWDRDWRWFRRTLPLWGVVIAAAIVAPWAIAIGVASHGAFYQQSLGHDFAAKVMGGEESHGAPPGYYAALASLTFWPATLFLIPALASAIANRVEPAIRYLLAWSGAVWVMFELVPTKLPHYILPVWPALALLCAMWIERRGPVKESPRASIVRGIAGIQFGLVAAAFALASAYLPLRFGGVLTWPLLTGMAIAFAAACAALVVFAMRQLESAAAFAMGSAVAFYLLLAFGVVPQMQELWLSPRSARLIAENRRPNDPAPVISGDVEPSLVFALGGHTRVEGAGDAAGVAAAQGGLALIDQKVQPLFLQGLSSSGAEAQLLGQASGFDYSNGHEERLTLYRVTPAAGSTKR
jgi:4-amino-4-deoxy-L-arabinose transferase-like glycosyltransferase